MAGPFLTPWQCLRALILFFPCMSFALVDIRAAFNLARPNTGGNCEARINQLNGFFSEADQMTTDAINMLRAAISTTPDIGENERGQAQRAATTWLSALTDADRGVAIDTFRRIRDFLDRGQNADHPQKPAWLFCDDTWLAKHQWTNPVQNQNGAFILVPTSTGTRFKLIQEQYPTRFQQNPGLLPYFAASIGTYVLDLDYGTSSYCGESNLGATQDESPNAATMTLCPVSFNSGASAPAASLGADGGNGPGFQRYAPPSLTMYHELFHLVLGAAQSDDVQVNNAVGNAVGDVNTRLIATRAARAANRGNRAQLQRILRNPESYTWFALQAWYFYRRNQYFNPDENGVVDRLL
ncbi:uncharacterized protein B0T15DRAFT_560767 [Chaetomium strumarium]|uniref:Lysine-specific metallo-endopeptidase domain-containing protein n=1 Tax=Chaetomium strumarium TaxID=1170767 RepID=A0AAJ0LZP6_9PEZI|nr:hypothetical protein B0T15DRAFT_560767 [Chaetomium strumarium]